MRMVLNLSLDELISSWNELTVNANKKAAKVNELEEKVEALKVELEKSDDRIEELEERVDIEVEMNLKALDKSAEWREKQLKEVKSAHVLREK
ncbi:6746_t:CDS:2 [Entrophospora sp. SA101]|nr:6746_t:CDS:2 [Entrophospora sp. SA101]